MIRVVVVDDHPAVRLSFMDFLDAHDDVEVVGEADNGLDAVELCAATTPHVVLMDIRMPVMDGIEATRLIKSSAPETRVILMTAYEQDDLFKSAERAGADRCVLKGMSGGAVVDHVREVAA